MINSGLISQFGSENDVVLVENQDERTIILNERLFEIATIEDSDEESEEEL